MTERPNIKLSETVKKAYAYAHNKLMEDIKYDIKETTRIIKENLSDSEELSQSSDNNEDSQEQDEFEDNGDSSSSETKNKSSPASKQAYKRSSAGQVSQK